MIAFTVPGDPVPQPRPKVSTRGGFARAYVPAKHPVHAYRQAVALAAKAAGLGQRSSPMTVAITLVFQRPASHMNAKGVVKASAPPLPRPDCDNLGKAVLDALGDFFDDSLVERLVVVKQYGSNSSTSVVIQ